MEKGIKVTGGWFNQSFVLSFDSEKDFIDDLLANSCVFFHDDEKTRRLKLKAVWSIAQANAKKIDKVVETPKKVNSKKVKND